MQFGPHANHYFNSTLHINCNMPTSVRSVCNTGTTCGAVCELALQQGITNSFAVSVTRSTLATAQP